jgi:hypothetical protein
MKLGRRSIVLSVFSGIVIVAFATVRVGLGFFISHHQSSPVSEQSAESEFSQLRKRFSYQQPLIDMSIRHVSETPAIGQSVEPLHTFHTVIFDTRGSQRIVHIMVPFWFARLFADRNGEFKWLGQLTFLDDTEFDGEAIRLSLDQLERRGPCLIIDYQHPSGGQFISWVE